MIPRQGVLEKLTSSTQTVEGPMRVSTFTVSLESVKAPEFVDITSRSGSQHRISNRMGVDGVDGRRGNEA